MADKTPEQEPSIEEILASIRQIISDDDEKDTADDSSPAEAIVMEDEPVLEAAQDNQDFSVDVADEPIEEDDDILELTDPIKDEPVKVDLQEHAEPPAYEGVEMEEPAMPEINNNDILTESARAATISSMAKLAGNMPVTRHREHGNITLEDLVREMLQPMLKDWLSESLPPMVERMVQKELEKLARQAQDV